MHLFEARWSYDILIHLQQIVPATSKLCLGTDIKVSTLVDLDLKSFCYVLHLANYRTFFHKACWTSDISSTNKLN